MAQMVNFTHRITPADREALDKLAAKENRSVGHVIRELIPPRYNSQSKLIQEISADTSEVDFELKSKLKNVPVPERTEEYWDDFPTRVRSQLRRPPPPAELRENWLPSFSWKFGFSVACLVIGLLVFNQPLKAASTVSVATPISRGSVCAVTS